MQTSNRTKATMGLVGAAVVAGLALGGGGTPDVGTASVSSVTSPATSAASAAASSAVASAASSAASQAGANVQAQAGTLAASGGLAAAGSNGAGSSATGSNISGTTSTSTSGITTTTSGSDVAAGSSVVLVLDSSRSMKTVTTGTTTRMDEARAAMEKVIADLPADTRVGLRVYGSTVSVADPLKPSAEACRDSRAVVPIGPVDKPRLKAVVSVFAPYGYTPTSYALEQAAADLGTTGKRTIILVSDGEESCPVDPAATAKRLRSTGIDLTISTVGLHAEPAAATQLQDVATAGGGTYTSAQSSSELQSGLQGILDRMRAGAGETSTSGTRVTAAGTAAASTGTTGTTTRRTATSTSSSSSGSTSHLPAGFVTALLLVALFVWLSDHK